jgi:hypothetical protein
MPILRKSFPIVTAVNRWLQWPLLMPILRKSFPIETAVNRWLQWPLSLNPAVGC